MVLAAYNRVNNFLQSYRIGSCNGLFYLIVKLIKYIDTTIKLMANVPINKLIRFKQNFISYFIFRK